MCPIKMLSIYVSHFEVKRENVERDNINEIFEIARSVQIFQVRLFYFLSYNKKYQIFSEETLIFKFK